MTKFDKTGPQGKGPKTGNCRGWCSQNTQVPTQQGQGYRGAGRRRGQGRGFGRGKGQGLGQGLGQSQSQSSGQDNGLTQANE
jgi:hypothetical protein